MTKSMRFLLSIALSLMFCFISIGYASLSDDLKIDGSVSTDPPQFDEIIITEVQALSGTTATSETNLPIVPTNIRSSITASAGQKILYRVTAKNYSQTTSYVYTGIYCSDAFADAKSKISSSAYTDVAGANTLQNNVNASYVSGTAVAPGETFVFYVSYDITANVSLENLLVKCDFKPVIYTITYLNDNEIYKTDHIVDNTKVYNVRTDYPANSSQVFAGWMNANANIVKSYPAGNTNDYTLSAKWENTYLIIFVDENGEVIYEEYFTNSTKSLSAEGQKIIDAKLAELARAAAADEMTVSWSAYNISTAKADIIVRPVYTYTGNLQFTPIDEDGDGITDYYQLDAVAKLKDPTKIPGRFNGLNVKIINKLYLNEDNFDYGAGVTTIEVGEGVTTINRNALAYTEDLAVVKLPSTLESIGKNAFSRNFGSDKKKLTIEFNGTMAEWQALVNNSHDEWHNGLKTGSVVKCSDGYFELDRGFLELGGYNWKSHKY